MFPHLGVLEDVRLHHLDCRNRMFPDQISGGTIAFVPSKPDVCVAVD